MNKTIGRYMRNAKELGNGKPAIQDNLKVSTPFALPLPVLIFAIIAILMEASLVNNARLNQAALAGS